MHTLKIHSNRSGIFVLFSVCLLTVQACGSSGTDAVNQNSANSFSAPVDAASLKAALITGSPSNASAKPWECDLSDGMTRLSYHLLSDNTGIETNLNNPVEQSLFTWEATSATSIVTTVTTTGLQSNLTNIRFTDRNTVNIMVTPELALACMRASDVPVTPTSQPVGDQSLDYGGVVYELTHGFEEAYSYRPSQRNDTHTASQFAVANQPFRSLTLLAIGTAPTTVIWRPNGASVWLRATLYSPGGERFESATFDYEPDSTDAKGASVAGRYFFQDGRFGADVDESGSIDSETNEFVDISSGTITVTRLQVGARMSFNVRLANGVSVSGSFEGSFPLYENF